jgi:integral membrane protein (TIGR01906 family)
MAATPVDEPFHQCGLGLGIRIMNKFTPVLSWLVTLLVPVLLIGIGVRVLLTPAFPQFEYRLPSFPSDSYGFTTADRVRWGTHGINYLLNDSGISYLGALKFPDGSPLFSERELDHMHDVKGVTQVFLRGWYAILALVLALGAWAWRAQWVPDFLVGLRRGGGLTLLLALAVGAVGTLGASGPGDVFWAFFSDFHGLFFTGESWIFSYSDTLIRLYPLRFWQDAVLYIGIITGISAAALAFGIRDPAHRAEP